MSGVTDADRERAWLVLCALPISIPGYSPETVRKAQDHLAAALAEERQKARAPFLAILDVEPDIQPLWEFERGVLRGIEMTKEAIRRAAEADA